MSDDFKRQESTGLVLLLYIRYHRYFLGKVSKDASRAADVFYGVSLHTRKRLA